MSPHVRAHEPSHHTHLPCTFPPCPCTPQLRAEAEALMLSLFSATHGHPSPPQDYVALSEGNLTIVDDDLRHRIEPEAEYFPALLQEREPPLRSATAEMTRLWATGSGGHMVPPSLQPTPPPASAANIERRARERLQKERCAWAAAAVVADARAAAEMESAVLSASAAAMAAASEKSQWQAWQQEASRKEVSNAPLSPCVAKPA